MRTLVLPAFKDLTLREIGVASQLLGHTDPAITIRHYIRRNETVDPTTAGLLEKAFG